MVRATATETEWVDPVTDDHLRAIGRVMVEWSRTERVIMDSLWELATGQSFDRGCQVAVQRGQLCT